MARRRKLVVASALYNNLKYIEGMLATIETKHDAVVMLVDNGSTDCTHDFIHKFMQFPGHSAISFPENKGVAHAWNTAITAASQQFGAEYILILGNDTLLSRSCIDRLVQTANRTKAAIVTATDYSKDCEKPIDIIGYQPHPPEVLTDCPDFSCFLLRISAALELRNFEQDREQNPGLFDTRFYPAYFEDNDYHYRLKLAGLRAIKTNKAAYYHFLSATKKENPEIAAQIDQTYCENEAYYCRKWGGAPGKETSTSPTKQWI
jgi:GT2 family glycosyltransferase